MNEVASTRLRFEEKFVGKDTWITFTDGPTGITYRYPHDQLMSILIAETSAVAGTESWETYGSYSFPRLSAVHHELLKPYIVKQTPSNAEVFLHELQHIIYEPHVTREAKMRPLYKSGRPTKQQMRIIHRGIDIHNLRIKDLITKYGRQPEGAK